MTRRHDRLARWLTRLALTLFFCGGTEVGADDHGAAASADETAPGELARLAPELVPGKVLLQQSERDALRERLGHVVFRAEASYLPPEPYEPTAMVYDGAVCAVDFDGPAFLSASAWLVGADSVVLLLGEQRVPLRVESLDTRRDVAVLRVEGEWPSEVLPTTIASATPMNAYAILSPGTAYEQFTTVAVLPDETELGLYWTTSLAAANGYPLFDADGAVVALQARRHPDEPTSRGQAVGWTVLEAMIHPEEDRAPGREPDHVLTVDGAGW